MHRTEIYAFAACLIVFLGSAADYGIGKVPVSQSHKVPIQTFPAKVSDWIGGPLISPDPSLKQKLPTATIRERQYEDSLSNSVDLTLVTASNYIDMHDPTICFPAQGWIITKSEMTQTSGQKMHMLTVLQDGQKMTVYYWWTGYYPPPPAKNDVQKVIAGFRDKVVNARVGSSLLVRVVATQSSCSDDRLKAFLASILPPVQTLVNEGGKAS
jgi:hypothetical protein